VRARGEGGRRRSGSQAQAAAGKPAKEEEGRGKEGGEKKKEKREKEKERKGNRKKENKGRKIEKGFTKLGEIPRKIRREVKKGFCGFFWVSQIPALIPGRR
jgi:spore coat protein B